MNKLYNQSNEEIIACGTEGSPIRCKTEYNLTFEKMFNVLKYDFKRKNITNDSYLIDIMICDEIPQEHFSNMLKAVKFYFKEYLNNHINIKNETDMENNEKLSKALTEFKTKYPSITSGDLQTFIIGWNESLKNNNNINIDKNDVEWIVNDNGELGVKIFDKCFWLYKGESLVYPNNKHDDGTPIKYRSVGKREFGECCHPIHLKRIPKTYTEGDGWKEL